MLCAGRKKIVLVDFFCWSFATTRCWLEQCHKATFHLCANWHRGWNTKTLDTKQTPRSKEPSIDLVTFRKRIYLEKCWRENPQRGSEYVCPVIYMYIYIVSIYWVYVLMHVSNSPSKVLGVWSHNCWVEIELTCAITRFAPWQAWLAG